MTIVILLQHYTPFSVILFTPFTNPQPMILVHLVSACPGQHGQPSYSYIFPWHARVDIDSHFIGCNDPFHTLHTITSRHYHTLHTIATMHCHAPYSITPIHSHAPYSITPSHCHDPLQHYTPFIVIVFTPFTHPQPKVLRCLAMAFRVDIVSHISGTSCHGMSSSPPSAQ